MLQPDVASIYALLNKEKLQAACARVGIDIPQTWFPRDIEEVATLSKTVPLPLLIKPQTQILFVNHIKGTQVRSADELLPAYKAFIQENAYGERVRQYDPQVGRPMLQAFHTEAAQNIYSISGFYLPEQDLYVDRGAVKVLQRPRKLGVGLCFEHAPVDAAVANKLKALCRELNYFGVFEVELIRANGKLLLIDFNPRFYGQMNFEIARSLPLPVLVYLAALGEKDRLRQAVEAATASPSSDQAAYCHRFTFELLLRAQGLSGKLSAEEVRYWKEWHQTRGTQVTDAVLDPADLLPVLVDTVSHLRGFLRHPRSFLRTMVLDL